MRWLPLFVGRFDFVRLDLNGADISALSQRRRRLELVAPPPGVRGRPVQSAGDPRFSLNDGRVRFEDDKRNMVLERDVHDARKHATRDDPGQFALIGEGEINNRPFTLELTGAPLLNVRRDRPYAFHADVRAGGNAHRRRRRHQPAVQFQRLVTPTSTPPAPTSPISIMLIGLALPNTPPYDLTGRVERNGHVYGMPTSAGRVGDSDLRGALHGHAQRNDRLFPRRRFPHQQSRLRRRAWPCSAGRHRAQETASAEQRADGRAPGARKAGCCRMRSSTSSRVRNMDARVSYRAARVRSERFPLRGLALDVNPRPRPASARSDDA